jgi:hypothetical protein
MSTIAGRRCCWATRIAIVSIVDCRSSGDLDNSNQRSYVLKDCYCDCDYREKVPLRISAVTIVDVSRCESKIVCLCAGAIENDKELITEMLGSLATHDGLRSRLS